VAALALAVCASTLTVRGQGEGVDPAGDPPPAPAPAPLNGGEPGVLTFPSIRIDVPNQRVDVRGWFVIDSPRVPLEYLLTTPEGKMHETLIASECGGDHLMLGLIMLGLEPVAGCEGRGDPRPLSGPRVALELTWTDAEGQQRTARAEDLLFDLYHRRTMEHVGFAFTGSRFLVPQGAAAPRRKSGGESPEVLAAQKHGSLIALYHDPDAVLDNPLLAGGDVPVITPTFGRPEVSRLVPGDERYVANPELVPARGTPVTITARPVAAEQLPAPSDPARAGGRSDDDR
jgi:hypothetical protein